MPAATSARMAAGVSCGMATTPGRELVIATTMPIANAPNSIKPMPPGRNWSSGPDQIRAASEISDADGDDGGDEARP